MQWTGIPGPCQPARPLIWPVGRYVAFTQCTLGMEKDGRRRVARRATRVEWRGGRREGGSRFSHQTSGNATYKPSACIIRARYQQYGKKRRNQDTEKRRRKI